MSVSIRKATLNDIPAIARIAHYGFRNHTWTRAMYPVEDAKGNIGRYEMRMKKVLNEPKDTLFVAVGGAADDPTAPVLGYSKWTIHADQRDDKEWNVQYESIPVPEGARQDASDKIGKALHEMRLRVYKGDPHVLLHFLVIDPDHQRKGIGAKLLLWGLQKSDELRLPAYLESTLEGEGLYYKNGFRYVDEMRVDGNEWGVSEPICLKCMKYESGSRTQT